MLLDAYKSTRYCEEEDKMPVEEVVIEKLRRLPPAQQAAVLRFVEHLELSAWRARPRQSAKGLWADLEIDLTEDELDSLRQEMWESFPREFPE